MKKIKGYIKVEYGSTSGDFYTHGARCYRGKLLQLIREIGNNNSLSQHYICRGLENEIMNSATIEVEQKIGMGKYESLYKEYGDSKPLILINLMNVTEKFIETKQTKYKLKKILDVKNDKHFDVLSIITL